MLILITCGWIIAFIAALVSSSKENAYLEYVSKKKSKSVNVLEYGKKISIADGSWIAIKFYAGPADLAELINEGYSQTGDDIFGRYPSAIARTTGISVADDTPYAHYVMKSLRGWKHLLVSKMTEEVVFLSSPSP